MSNKRQAGGRHTEDVARYGGFKDQKFDHDDTPDALKPQKATAAQLARRKIATTKKPSHARPTEPVNPLPQVPSAFTKSYNQNFSFQFGASSQAQSQNSTTSTFQFGASAPAASAQPQDEMQQRISFGNTNSPQQQGGGFGGFGGFGANQNQQQSTFGVPQQNGGFGSNQTPSQNGTSTLGQHQQNGAIGGFGPTQPQQQNAMSQNPAPNGNSSIGQAFFANTIFQPSKKPGTKPSTSQPAQQQNGNATSQSGAPKANSSVGQDFFQNTVFQPSKKPATLDITRPPYYQNVPVASSSPAPTGNGSFNLTKFLQFGREPGTSVVKQPQDGMDVDQVGNTQQGQRDTAKILNASALFGNIRLDNVQDGSNLPDGLDIQMGRVQNASGIPNNSQNPSQIPDTSDAMDRVQNTSDVESAEANNPTPVQQGDQYPLDVEFADADEYDGDTVSTCIPRTSLSDRAIGETTGMTDWLQIAEINDKSLASAPPVVANAAAKPRSIFDRLEPAAQAKILASKKAESPEATTPVQKPRSIMERLEPEVRAMIASQSNPQPNSHQQDMVQNYTIGEINDQFLASAPPVSSVSQPEQTPTEVQTPAPQPIGEIQTAPQPPQQPVGSGSEAGNNIGEITDTILASPAPTEGKGKGKKTVDELAAAFKGPAAASVKGLSREQKSRFKSLNQGLTAWARKQNQVRDFTAICQYYIEEAAKIRGEEAAPSPQSPGPEKRPKPNEPVKSANTPVKNGPFTEDDADEVDESAGSETTRKLGGPTPKLPDSTSSASKLFSSTLDNSNGQPAAPTAPATATVAPPAFKLPTFTAPASGNSFLSAFGKKADAEGEKERKKRKAEDYDSDDETPEEWEKRDREVQEAKRQKIMEAAKSAGGFEYARKTSPAKPVTATDVEKAQGPGNNTWTPQTPIKFGATTTDTSTTPAFAPPKTGLLGASNAEAGKLAPPTTGFNASLETSRATTPGVTTDGEPSTTAEAEGTADGEPSEDQQDVQMTDLTALLPEEQGANEVLKEIPNLKSKKLVAGDDGKPKWVSKGDGRAYVLKHKKTGKTRLLQRVGLNQLALNYEPVKGMTYALHPKKETMVTATFFDHLHCNPAKLDRFFLSCSNPEQAKELCRFLTEGALQ
ncbi:hypothetical protein PRZ48_004523 [Zasmidium cellare]|uniref:RanBD1 domain-containing protein n=1 Tax=Zasmidium cellare TaxID=395010 RepID=A0ABR0ER85_ZASCE|nr:hypothetical protein PRZ48_004523 [Zasmidium cellare]